MNIFGAIVSALAGVAVAFSEAFVAFFKFILGL